MHSRCTYFAKQNTQPRDLLYIVPIAVNAWCAENQDIARVRSSETLLTFWLPLPAVDAIKTLHLSQMINENRLDLTSCAAYPPCCFMITSALVYKFDFRDAFDRHRQTSATFTTLIVSIIPKRFPTCRFSGLQWFSIKHFALVNMLPSSWILRIVSPLWEGRDPWPKRRAETIYTLRTRFGWRGREGRLELMLVDCPNKCIHFPAFLRDTGRQRKRQQEPAKEVWTSRC